MQEALNKLPRTMTVAEFLDWPGDGSGRKFQLVDGELRAMSPGSATHGTIQMTLGGLIRKALIDAGGGAAWSRNRASRRIYGLTRTCVCRTWA